MRSGSDGRGSCEEAGRGGGGGRADVESDTSMVGLVAATLVRSLSVISIVPAPAALSSAVASVGLDGAD
jgi:hypothetical protein